ncbi:D-alanyl-D-alanine carboxypeptidase [Nocardioides sp. BE266]|uniref:serine hydrolase domain-containing protein n=1 Tax=Nocardioides sp. BE266 TaxID=2817725 RepID=UPI002861C9D2|nr:serine hydrolase domain-containing protein [Nocardioides sp. BE266]MDR7251395.1 D-alanyl-D-alanine carboxypeptidase [Nocardioides sp. BE266]
MSSRLAVAMLCGVLLASCSSADDGSNKGDQGAPTSSTPTADVSVDALARAMEERLELLEGTYPAALALVRVGDQTAFVSAGPPVRARRGSGGSKGGGEQLTDRHRFQIGSVSKTMLAVAVLQLVEDGNLSLTDTVEQHVPGLVPDGDQITVEDLLAHRSGLFNYTDSMRFLWDAHWEPTELVELATARSPEFDPGEDSSYSNTNYVVLGLIAEQVAGQPLDRILDERVFSPALMTDTSASPGRVTDAPLVHGYEGRRDVTLTDMSMAWGAGGVVSSARDLDRFLQALTGGVLVDSSTFEDMRTWRGDLLNRNSTSYGLGLGELNAPCDVEMVGHSGGLPGFGTEAWTVPDGTRSVVAMTNDVEAGAILTNLITAAICS